MKKTIDYNLTPLQILKKYWGYDSLRPQQGEVIDSVMDGCDTLAILSTGAGKSLTYQLPAMASEGLTVVISPLISLIKDQVDSLRRRGIAAVALHSGMAQRQIDVTLDNCIYGGVKLLYLAPERINSPRFLERIERMPIKLIVVDEAHCIWQWGHDFRPAYREIASLRHLLPRIPIMALTASATEEVRESIITNLELRQPNIFQGDLRRRNLIYVVRHTDDRDGMVRRIIERVEGSGIIYARSRKDCERLATMLNCDGFTTATAYHAALPLHERQARQERWTKGTVRVMVATNAFGMGIDKADVRFVIHYKMPNSLEEYYQEAGRAGRDGVRSYATLIAAEGDADIFRRQIESDFLPMERIRDIYDAICSHLGICYGEGVGQRLPFNLYDFCQRSQFMPREVMIALRVFQLNNYLHFADLDRPFSSVIFLASREELFALRDKGGEWSDFITLLARGFTSERIASDAGCDESEIAWLIRRPIEQVRERLERLHQMGYIKYTRSSATSQITFGCDRVEKRYLHITSDSYLNRKRVNLERQASMARYCENSDQCRSQVIEQYFGVLNNTPCGVCDICIERAERMEENVQSKKTNTEPIEPR